MDESILEGLTPDQQAAKLDKEVDEAYRTESWKKGKVKKKDDSSLGKELSIQQTNLKNMSRMRQRARALREGRDNT